MNKGKAIIKAILIILLIFLIVNIRKAVISGNQQIEITSGSNYYVGSNFEASIKVKDEKTSDSLSSKINVNLLDNKHKKVKNVSTKLEIEEETGNFSLNLPKDLETGKYFVQINCKSKKGNDTVEKEISIIGNEQNNINIVLDKGIYKPGDNIKYRALVTSKYDDRPAEENVEVSIYDGNDNRVYVENVQTSDFGIISGNFLLGNEINSGTYKIKVSTKTQEYSKAFKVNPYITPQFNAEIKTEKENYLVNDKINIVLDSKYFFGEPVKNAKVVLKINEQTQEGVTDSNGTFKYEYEASSKGNLNIVAEITDESNYLVETSKVVYVTEDIFEIEILPEYNTIINNTDNKIYFFVKNPNGSGKKAYLNVNAGKKITRQVITDEQGIGVINLSKADISGNIENNINIKKGDYSPIASSLELTIQAKDTDGNIISKKERLQVSKNTGVLIKTDKIKYRENDDITINLNAENEMQEKIVAICKNRELIKLITTDQDEITVNLENQYGLIDIFALSNDSHLYNTDNMNIKSKRTIFIKPNKSLNVEIETDKKEYSPKENINLQIHLTDENGNIVDGALLVSALDEAVLKIANNDLSIDNVKTALSGIKLSDDLDAATLYANIMDSKDESKLMAMLLKQNGEEPNISKRIYNTENEKFDAIFRTKIAIFIIACILIIYFAIRFETFRKIITNIIAVIGTYLSISIVIFALGNDGYYIEELPAFIISTIITLILYILFLYKYVKLINKLTIEYFAILLWVSIFSRYMHLLSFKLNVAVAILTLSLFPLMLIIAYFLRRKNIKPKLMEKLLFISKEMIKANVIVFLTGWSMIVGNLFGIAVFAVLNIIYEVKFGVKRKKEEKDLKKDFKIDLKNGIVIGVCIGILILVVGNFLLKYVIETFSLEDSNFPEYEYDTDYYSNRERDTSILDSVSPDPSISAGSASKGGILEKAFDSANLLFDSENENVSWESTTQDSDNIESSKTEEKMIIEENNQIQQEENVRSIFLESLCFIPELITNSGNSETSIPLSDNITSWKIQVVGNTKNGNIGYNASNITVKKDFFANFTMPTNSIVGDNISIPLTIHNYTENNLTTNINVETADWFNIGNFETSITVDSKSTKMIYLPITILKEGENLLKVKVTSGEVQDILQKSMIVKNKGLEVSKVVSSGNIDKNMAQDIIYDVQAVEGTRNLKIKLYPSAISQIVEGLENIFRMPTGCFEQTSSSLYPDVMVLKYMQDNNIINEKLKEKALQYISSGYQRLLTFEVKGEKGGYSLYGDAPSNPSLTAYGLMELTDLSTVYTIDSNVISNMKEYLYGRQKSNGSFNIGSTYYSDHIVKKTDDITLNTYIIWALSETDSKDKRLENAISYLKKNLDKLTDSYTIALAANAFANVNENETANKLIERLLNKVDSQNNQYYLKSNIIDCYGTRGNIQNLQTTALTSIALSKMGSNAKMNANLIDYIMSRKDSYGTWQTTQATILCLKALVTYQSKSNISNQTIKVKLNDDEKTLEIKNNALDIYEVNFENLGTENHLDIDMQKGQIYYEIVENYYQDSKILKENSNNKIDVSFEMNNSYKVNEVANSKIKVKNTSEDFIKNGMIEITIPQGFTVKEETLSKLVANKQIQKYEYNYSKIYLYIQDFEKNAELALNVEYRASFPGKIAGGAIRVYDYYNPEIEGMAEPIEIEIKE